MNTLGIYFGPQLVGIVEAKDNKTVKYIQVSQAALSTGESLEEKVPISAKLATAIKSELIRNDIEANEAIVSISGKDLIVRTFEMPILPRQELDTAVNFEVKKYIPFKVEDLISDFQYKFDKSIRKTRVLFVGIKKDALDKYLDILNQVGIRIKAIEYSAFSILRLFKLAAIKEKGIVAVINIDLTKDDEANFVVIEGGFPLFSRDISLMAGSEEIIKTEENQQGVILEKLKREIQISLDYYDRKFPGKNISKLFFIANIKYQADLDGFIKELNLNTSFIDVNKYIDTPIPFCLPFVKAYSSSLFRINIDVKIDLLLAKEKVVRKSIQLAGIPASLIERFKWDLITAAFCLIVLIVVFLLGIYRSLPVQEELRNIINIRPVTSTVSWELSDKELLGINSEYKLKAESIDAIIKSRLYLTPLLDAIPRVVPKGMRLMNLSFSTKGEEIQLILEGTVYLADAEKESELVNVFLSNIKVNAAFNKYFNEISIVSVVRKQTDKAPMTHFNISCKGLKKSKMVK